MTTSTVHPKLDYAGGTFGRPETALFSKSWRVKHGMRKDTVTATLLGQDSVGVSSLEAGFPVYAGYAYGPFDNWAALVARFGKTSKLISISPSVEDTERVACLDVEPGNATPAESPAFVRLGQAGILNKPTIYCSAGDISAVVDAMSNAGISRNSYYIWSAHWIGLHICGPATCGYPQADGCQYASNNAFDSDVFTASMFVSVKPPTPPKPPVPPADWSYGAPLNLKVVAAGHTTVKLSWTAPLLNGHAAVDHFVVWIYDHGQLVGTYPRNIPGTDREWEGGGLVKGVSYVAHLGASGPIVNGKDTRLGKDVYASVPFTTG